MKKQRIAVFCGSSMGLDPAYEAAARELGALMASQSRTLVYGSGNLGLMGAISDAVKENGGHTVGINVTRFHRAEFEPMSHVYMVTKDLAERKAVMLDECDASIALPGGIGTLDELSEVLVQLQIGGTKKPIGLLNVKGFYDPLIALIQNMVTSGFLKAEHGLFVVAASPEELLAQLDACV